MKILVTNDDGMEGVGLEVLIRYMAEVGEVTVVVPQEEKSATGHSVTVSAPLRIRELGDKGGVRRYVVNGTPVDCVKLALRLVMKDNLPDIVVSGINKGVNTGTHILYSGTVAGALEAVLMGIHAVAISIDDSLEADYEYAGKVAREVVKQVIRKGLPEGCMLNVNVPGISAKEIKGIRITKQGKVVFINGPKKGVDPRNREYYWLVPDSVVVDEESLYDTVAVQEGYVSITPLTWDMTYHKLEGFEVFAEIKIDNIQCNK